MKPELEKIQIASHSSVHINMLDLDYFDAPWHYHPEYEITLIQKGKGVRFVGGHAQEYADLDLVGLAPDIPHHWKSNLEHPGSKAIVIQFNPVLYGKHFWELPEMKGGKAILNEMQFGLSFIADETIKALFQQISQEEGLSRTNLLFVILSKLSQLTYTRLLSSNDYASIDLAKSRLEKVYLLVKKHFKENLKVNDYANEVALTKESFSRFFKQKTGQTFISYLNNYRIEYASKLLKETNMKIIEIAYESGFQNLSNFNRRFKEIKKRSPLEYKLWIEEDRRNTIDRNV